MAQTVKQQPKPTPTPLAMQRDSHMISKCKPKIRIIHIFAPRIIKTDVANFRELVQRLTGKPTEESHETITRNNVECEHGYQSSDYFGSIEGDEVAEAIWRAENSNGFLHGLEELDGFIQGLGQFPLVPLNVASSHLDVYGETQLC